MLLPAKSSEYGVSLPCPGWVNHRGLLVLAHPVVARFVLSVPSLCRSRLVALDFLFNASAVPCISDERVRAIGGQRPVGRR